MHKFQNIQDTPQFVYNYLPAVLKKYKSGWVIEFFAENPVDGHLARRRVRVDMIRKRYVKIADAMVHINKMIADINCKLAKGWSPFIQESNARGYSYFNDVINSFLTEKTKELRPDTIRSYQSDSRLFLEWLEENGYDNLFVTKFTKALATRYLEYIYNVRNVSQNTYNNHLRFLRVLFNWMQDHSYITYNVFNEIKPKRKTPKKRVLIPAEIRTQIIDYLTKNNPKYLIVCKMVYYCLIRPKEIRHLKVGNVDFYGNAIRITEDNAKNHHCRIVPVPPDLMTNLQYLKDYSKELYIFGTDLKPAKRPAYDAKFTKLWDAMRRRLHFSNDMQLYSLRDTAMTDFIKAGMDPLTVKQLADHYSLNMTTIYTNHADNKLFDIYKTKVPTF